MPNSFSTFLIDTPNIKDGAVTTPKIKDANVVYGKVKKTPGSASGSVGAGATVEISMSYGTFFPLVYGGPFSDQLSVISQGSYEVGYVGCFRLRNDEAASADYTVNWQYIPSS